MNNTQKSFFIILIISVVSGLFFIPFSGAVHLFDWDEIIYAEAAREMISSKDYLTVTINYEPFYEKPPFFFWLQVASMKVFGINEFAARFPNALCGILTLISLFVAGKKIMHEKFGVYWAVSHGTAILPFFYFQSGIIDPWFNLFILVSILTFLLYLEKQSGHKYLKVIISALSLGLAVLTKGPVSLIIFILTIAIFFIIKKPRPSIRKSHIFVFIIVLLLSGGSWFIVYLLSGNIEILKDFIHYQVNLFSESFTTHAGFPGFHFVVLLFGMFPASIIALSGFYRKREINSLYSSTRQLMAILLVVVLVLFSIVQTKLVHYSSLAYFPVSFFAANAIERWNNRQLEFRPWQLVLLAGIPIFIGLGMLIFQLLVQNPELLSGIGIFNNFFSKGYLHPEFKLSFLDFLPGVILILGSILAVYKINRRDRQGIFLIQLVILLFIYNSMLLYVPKVERITQYSKIEFFKLHADSPYPAIALGFTSYAQYFYGHWEPGEFPGRIEQQWIENNPVVYVIVKSERLEKIKRQYPDLEIQREEYGFAFGVIKN